MEVPKLQFNGRTEGFFIGRFVFESKFDVNVTRESVRYHNFITAIFVRIFGSGIIDIKTERGTIIHLNKGSVEKLVNKSSETDDDYLPDYVKNLKKLLVPSREEGSSSLKNDLPEMFTDANEPSQKSQSYFNNQNTEKTDVKVQTEKKRAKCEEYKKNIKIFLEKEKQKLEKAQEDFLNLEFTKKEDVEQHIDSFINSLPVIEPQPRPEEDLQSEDFFEEISQFYETSVSEANKIHKSILNIIAKSICLLRAARALKANDETEAKKEAEEYPNDPMFKKLFELFDTPFEFSN